MPRASSPARARQHVRGNVEVDGETISRHRELAEAFLKAARSGDMAALLDLLNPGIVFTADARAAHMRSGKSLLGSEQVARFFSGRAAAAHVAVIDGDIGIIVAPADRLMLVVMPRFAHGRVTHLHAIAAPDDLASLDMGL